MTPHNPNPLLSIMAKVVEHHRNNPDHGIDCACMDGLIQQLRTYTNLLEPDVQRRMDYVMRKATENRPN